MLCVTFCLSLVLVAGTRAHSSEQAESWDYTFNGNDWGGLCRRGKKQSPIDINTKWTNNKVSATPLQFLNYEETLPVRVVPNDHTVNVYPNQDNVKVGISGGGLNGLYVLQQVHFHWGSEHLINSQRYALEAHLVHYKETYGNNTQAATKDPEGIAVLGVLYCQGPSNFNIEKVIEGVSDSVSLNFQDFLPADLDFYRYPGSLTTPPCAEAVVWTVFKNRVTLSKLQLEKLKNLLPQRLHSTYRNVQALNHREVEKWEVSEENPNKVNTLKSSTKLLVAAPFLVRNVRGIL